MMAAYAALMVADTDPSLDSLSASASMSTSCPSGDNVTVTYTASNIGANDVLKLYAYRPGSAQVTGDNPKLIYSGTPAASESLTFQWARRVVSGSPYSLQLVIQGEIVRGSFTTDQLSASAGSIQTDQVSACSGDFD